MVFNPDIPEINAPDYTRASHPISEPKFISTEGMALKDAGDTFELAAKGADEVQKSYLTEEVRDTVVPMRDTQIAQLQDARKALGDTPDVNVAPGELPPQVRDIPKTLDLLKKANGSGRISDTDFYGRVDAALSDIRNRNPAYKDWIDSQSEKILGVNAANAYMKGQVADINALLQTGKDQRTSILNKLDTLAIDKGNKVAASTASQLRHGFIDIDTAVGVMANENSWISQNERMESNLKAEAAHRTWYNQGAEDLANLNLSRSVTEFYRSLPELPGLKKDENGHMQMSGPNAQQNMLIMEKARADFISHSLSLMNTPPLDASGKPTRPAFATTLGATKTQEMLQAHLKNWDQLRDYYTNDKSGIATYATRMNEAILQGDILATNMDKDTGLPYRLLRVADKTGSSVATNAVIQTSFGPDMPAKLAKSLSLNQLDMFTRPPENPLAPKEVVNMAQKAGITFPRYYDKLFETNLIFADPSKDDPQAKLAYSLGVISPKNYGLFSEIQPGKSGGNQYSVFRQFGTPEFVTQIKKSDADSGGKFHIAEGYESFMRTSFINDLFRQNLNDLKPINFSSPSSKINYHTDNGKHEFSVEVGGRDYVNLSRATYQDPMAGNPAALGREAAAATVNAQINKLNSGIDTLVNVAKGLGKDPDAYIFQVLREGGLTPENMMNAKGIPTEIAKALYYSSEANRIEKEKIRKEKERVEKP